MSDEPIKTLNLEHTAMTYKSSEVIGIEINATMTIEPGFVLVIPLHRPNALTTMPREQFRILFPETVLASPETVSAQETIQESMAPQVPASSDALNGHILAYLTQRKRGVKAKVIAGALGTTIKSVHERLQRLRDQGAVSNERDIWNSIRPTEVAATNAVSNGAQNVPPQLGRILYAMAYAEKISGKADLNTGQVGAHLTQRDKKQYSARLPEAVRRGWVMRGLPLPNVARGWHYQLTGKAREIIKGLGATPYEGERPPTWVARLAE